MMRLRILNDEAGLCRADLLNTEDLIGPLQQNFVAFLPRESDLLLRLALVIVLQVLIRVKVDELMAVRQHDAAMNVVNHLVGGALDNLVFELFRN